MQNIQPPRNRPNRDSPPPPQFARHGAHTRNRRATQRTGGIPRAPEPQTTERSGSGTSVARRVFRKRPQGVTRTLFRSPTQNIQSSSNRPNRRQPSPAPVRQARDAHTEPPRIYRNPGGTAAHPEYRYTRRCIYPLPRHQGVRALRGRVPCRSKEDNMHLAQQNCISRGTQKSRRFRRISGIFFQVRPLGLEPRTH